MATLLQFDPVRRHCAPRGGALEGTAKILFFTGIRYERQPEPKIKKTVCRKPPKLNTQRTLKKLSALGKRKAAAAGK